MKNKLLGRMLSVCSAGTLLFSMADMWALNSYAAEIDIHDFSISDVTMTDDYCTNAFDKEMDYLLSFDTERLLAGFRENAG
ncbi:MAG: hypothetical protein IKQ90_03820, partial [Ruminococcus sp.]|nr:hypothetical protein [Ruminococcus sp.]